MKSTEALAAIATPEAVELFGKYNVLSKQELHSRHDVYQEGYDETLQIEQFALNAP